MIIILYIAVIASAETYNTACGGHLAPLYAVKKHGSRALLRHAANTVSVVFILNIGMLIHASLLSMQTLINLCRMTSEIMLLWAFDKVIF